MGLLLLVVGIILIILGVITLIATGLMGFVVYIPLLAVGALLLVIRNRRM